MTTTATKAMSAMSIDPENASLANIAFERARTALQDTYTPWVITTRKGDRVALMIRRKTNNLKLVAKHIYEKYGGGLKCQCCHMFIKKFAGVGFRERSLFANTTAPYRALAGNLGDFERFEVVTGTLGHPTLGPFNHLAVTPATTSTLSYFTAADYDWFLHQNMGTMLRLLSENKGDGIVESLKALLAVLPEVNYGNKLAHSTRWFLVAMEDYMAIPDDADPNEKFLVAARALLTAHLSPGLAPERIICTPLKQVKDNGLDALATADSIPGLTALLEARFSPLTYRRPTAEATQGQLEEAMKLFKGLDFRVMLMLLANIVKYGGKLVASSAKTPEATEVWDKIRSKRGKRTAGGFAARASVTTIPSTMTALVDACPPGLEVWTGGVSPVCLTEVPESARVALKHPHLWAFQLGRTMSMYGLASSSWGKVNSMIFMGDNVFFGIEGARPAAKMGNTCFPSFLTDAYSQRCRSAFEELNKTDMEVPSGSRFALGVGDSRKDATGTCMRGLTFRLNDIEFKITKF